MLKGENMPQTSAKMDWLTVTKTGVSAAGISEGAMLARWVTHVLKIRTGGMVETAPQRFYQYCYTSQKPEGMTVAASESDTQGIRVTMSGTFLSGIDQQALAGRVIDQGWHVTRCDIAIDVIGTEHTVMDIDRQRQEFYEGRPRLRTLVDNPQGSTLYIGSRQSEKMLRIYDKGMEAKLGRWDWIRYEMEYKGNTARAALAVVKLGQFGAVIGDIIDFVGVKSGITSNHLADFAHTEGIVPVVPERDRIAWYESSVIPALDKLRRESAADYDRVIALLASNGHIPW